MSSYFYVPPSRGAVSSTGRPVRDLYVATTGNDTTGDGTSATPWATIDKARTVIQTNKYHYRSDVVVHVGAGNYFSTAVTFTPADCGNGYTVTYKSDTPGAARLIGGQLLGSWVNHSGSIFKTSLATPVWTLFENGRRARAARSPKLNPGASYPCSFAPYYSTAGVDASATVLQYNPVDFDPSTWTLADTRLTCWSVTAGVETDWFTDTHGASALNTTTKQYSLNDSGMKFSAKSAPAVARYFVHGPLQLLTEAGEFVCTGGQIYYWARDGAIASQEIISPTTKRVISLVGTSADIPMHDLVFDGLLIEGSDFESWYRWGTAAADYNYFYTPSTFQQAGLYLENCYGITIKNCHVKNTGFTGIFFQGYTRQNTVQNCWVEHTGSDGIAINGPFSATQDRANSNNFYNIIINNVGEMDGGGNGMRLSQTSSNVIRNLDIRQGPRRGLWIHGDYAVPASSNYAGSNNVSYVKVKDMMQDSGDAGLITVSFRSAPTPPDATPNVFNQIILDGSNAHSSMLDNALPSGLFFDNEASGQVVSNMQVSNVQGTLQRYNGCSGAVFTNVSFTGTFDATLMDTANIGVTSANPFKTAAGV